MSKPIRSGLYFPRYDARLHHGDEVRLNSKHGTWLSFVVDPLDTVVGRPVVFQEAATGKFCAVARSDFYGKIACDRDALPPVSEWLTVGRVGDKLSFSRMWEGGWRSCSDLLQGIRCLSEQTSTWELFTVLHMGEGRMVLQGSRTGRFCAGGGGGLVCDRDNFTHAAPFRFVSNVSLGASVAQTRDIRSAGTFVVHRPSLDVPSIALLCKGYGTWLAVDPATGLMSCTSAEPVNITFSHARAWEKAMHVRLQAASSGRYMEAEGPALAGETRAPGNESGPTLWKVYLEGGYETLRPLIRGVNLGNWFLLERWMAADLFVDAASSSFNGSCIALDEYGLMYELGPEVAKERMERHWADWITEEDIKWMAGRGINAVRVPFGYWMAVPKPPFIPGQLLYLDRLFGWCERHHVAVLLDFHGLSGSQTGNPTSGNCGPCGNEDCGVTHIGFLDEDNEKLNLQVIELLAYRYSRSPVYLGFSVANEVAWSADKAKTMRFYQRAYDTIRKYSEDSLVVMYASHTPAIYPFQNFQETWLDIHVYFAFGYGLPSLDDRTNLGRATEAVEAKHWQTLVGEWSLAESGHEMGGWEPAERASFLKRFARLQLQAYETSSTGWFYWNYKANFRNSTWSFRDMCEAGWVPGCTGELTYASAVWWNESASSFAYLEGLGGGAEPGPPHDRPWPQLKLIPRPPRSRGAVTVVLCTLTGFGSCCCGVLCLVAYTGWMKKRRRATAVVEATPQTTINSWTPLAAYTVVDRN